MFRYCEKCGLTLIERLPNGLWVFIFGWMPITKRLKKEVRRKFERKEITEEEHDQEIKDIDEIPVVKESSVIMRVQGSIKMKCFRSACRLENPDHWNIFHYFPDGALFQSIRNQRGDVEYNRTGASQNNSDNSDKKENKDRKEVI